MFFSELLTVAGAEETKYKEAETDAAQMPLSQDPANSASVAERRRDFCRIVATKRVRALDVHMQKPIEPN